MSPPPRDHVDLRVATYNIHRCRGLDRRVAARAHRRRARHDRPRHRRAAGSDRPRAGRPGPRRAARRGARHGLGDGADAGAAAAPVRQRRAQPVPDPRSRAARPVVEDLRAARQPARRDRSRRRPLRPRLQRAPRHGAARAPVPGAAAGDVDPDRRRGGPKIVLGDFNEWSRGLASDVLAERLESIDLYAHLKRRRTYPGFFPVLHLDHIYFGGDIEVRRDRAAAHAARDGRVGPPAARRRCRWISV